MPQSPELAGGEGFTYEGDVAAFYLTALLAEGYAPGIEGRTVVRVSVQQRDFGEPLDDVIVDFEDAARNSARLSLQVKRSLTVSDAESNTDFREIIRDSWATLNKPDFRISIDRYGSAVNTVTSITKGQALKTLCDWARESLTSEHFDARFASGGIASAEIRTVRDQVVTLLEEEGKGASCSREELHQFLAHFVLIQFDFLREGATDYSESINRILDCLAADDTAKAPLVWSRLVELARAAAGKAGQFDRARLVRVVSMHARLRAATSFRLDLEKLTGLAESYVNCIPDDVGGTRLERIRLLESLDTKLAAARIVQVRGLPGSGKSVVVKRVVQRALERGPVLFLKAEQLEGTSWISYAASHGLSGAPLEQLLLEVGAVGTPVLFLDAIDRIEKEHQPIILDVIRTIVVSPLLENWRIVVSLRDTGIEMLRNWLGEFLDAMKVEALSVGQLNDEEAETLATAKPNLRPMLFGPPQVREVVRRPFFAKVLNQSFVATPDASTFAPQSEVDLIENWWRLGGYSETGQEALERQRALVELARIRARQLSQPIRLGSLTSIVRINDLVADGILQTVREGVFVRFAHDIFFEWAFFYALADREAEWVDEIKACGEPPAVARVVELSSQWEYVHGKDWNRYIAQTEGSGLRSQWLRAWLVGPLGTARFEAGDAQFKTAAFSDGFRLFRKILVWFQAEKTTPNEAILAGALPQEERQRFADLLGWPSDYAAWRRLIGFILRHIQEVPQRLYPEVVAVFEVWQNALADLPNSTSHGLLGQCASWLAATDAISNSDGFGDGSEFWKQVPELGELRKALSHLILRASRAEPGFAAAYLQRISSSVDIRDDLFHDIIGFSPILVQSLPQPLVELSLAFLQEELPEEQISRDEQERRDRAKRRKALLAIPEAERTQKEQRALSMGEPLFPIGHFGLSDWENLSINDDHQSFWPPSPLREPFHSLFQAAPNEALRLLRVLCNHAMTAWRQLFRHSCDRRGTPIPLELTFPWGTQRFWGTDFEYRWFRSSLAPKAVACGLMALDEWCFAELERGRPADDLIRQILEGNECIAILGIASMVTLHTERVSETTLPLFTSQRLLAADYERMMQDLSSSTANLIGFSDPADKPHLEAVKAANARPVRRKQLLWMAPGFIFRDGLISKQAREALLNFKDNLPFQFEEHRDNPQASAYLQAQALEYAGLADPKNYQAYTLEEGSNQVAIVHVSPSAERLEKVARVEAAAKWLSQMDFLAWASKSLEERCLVGTHTIADAIELAKETDAGDLFEQSRKGSEEERLGTLRGAVAATAAVVLTFRDGCSMGDLEWACDVLVRAMCLPETSEPHWSAGTVVPWHHAIFVARGLAADLHDGTATTNTAHNLLELIAHPLECVSLAAFRETCQLWPKDPKLTWAGLILAFSLCHVPRRPLDQVPNPLAVAHCTVEGQASIQLAIEFYDHGNGWASLPLPPPAWVKLGRRRGERLRRHQWPEDYDADAVTNPAEEWGEPDVFWHSKRAAEFLKHIPFAEILNCGARNTLLDFLANLLEWTIQKNAPPWVKAGRRDRSATNHFEWTRTLGRQLGHVAGLVPLGDFRAHFLDPILALQGDTCWALLSPFASTYVCRYVYDAPTVPADATITLSLCLERLLQDSAFVRDSYHSGEIYGFDQPELVRTLMFVSVEFADMAARYVNGDWSEFNRILPLVDRFVRASGWASSVMSPFLTLCERAKSTYPAEVFADQVLAIIGEGPDNLKGWHGTFLPARIAGLVQHFSHRDAPMTPILAQKFLRILDILVDMGDRRSAALQLGEAFREVRVP